MKVKVYLHTQSWNVPGSKNSDLKLRKVFLKLSDYFPDITMYHPKAFMSGLEFVFKHALRRLSQLLFSKDISPFDSVRHHIYYPEFKKSKPDVIISQGHFPKKTYNTPVIWEIFFIDPMNSEVVFNENDEIKWKEKIDLYKELAQKATIIGVRDQYSIDLIKKLLPDSGHKARFLPFFIPKLKSLDNKTVIDKHNNNKVIKILFVGGGAKRKGLEQLILAFSELYKEVKNIELTIVSNMNGGAVNIPKNSPIVHHLFLPHEEVLKLFLDAHVYAMPSLHESFGLTYIEGMANGCAVLARNKYPQRDILEEGKSGVLVDPLNINEIVSGLKKICIDDNFRTEIALNGLKRFNKKYHWSAAGELWKSAIVEAKVYK